MQHFVNAQWAIYLAAVSVTLILYTNAEMLRYEQAEEVVFFFKLNLFVYAENNLSTQQDEEQLL